MVVVRDRPVGLRVKAGSSSLSSVSGEDVLSTVNVLAEEIVVDLLSVAQVTVFTSEKSKLGRGRRHEA